MQSPLLLVILGPTSVGKTDYCLAQAEQWQCPVVNCDSRQIYREIPIGTAAPTPEEQQRVQHYFVGTRSLSEDYNAGMYEHDAVTLLTRLAQQHNDDTPFAILSGGSMLYMDAVLKGLDNLPPVPATVRQQVRDNYQQQGLAWLQQEVQRLDPDYWLTVDQNNPQRLMHCIEISLAASRPYSALRTRSTAQRPWRTRIIGLTRSRDLLYERINRRVDSMMEQGLLDEARRAYMPFKQQGLPIPNSLQTVGYKELIAHLEGQCTLPEAVEKIKQHSRNYAKRQMTWFRAKTDISWLTL